jgi:hypothetical protein
MIKSAKIPKLIIKDIARARALESTPLFSIFPARIGQNSIGVVRESIKSPEKEAENPKFIERKVGK